jgi:N-acetylmuramoyl-L-alanine amidase
VGLRTATAATLNATPTKPAAQKKVVAMTPWEQAERGRAALEETPEASRTKADYARTIAAYKAIYFANPGDVHAAVAVNAVAELLAEQGRVQHAPKASRAALVQYEFLRTQYPGCSMRIPALLAEAQIEQNDLNDAAAAREKYQLLLKQYGKSGQAEEARAGLQSLKQGTWSRDQGSGKPAVAEIEGAGKPALRATLAPIPPTGRGATVAAANAPAAEAIEVPAKAEAPATADDAPSSAKPADPAACLVAPVKTRTAAAASAKGNPARPAVPTADGETSLVRALGLKVGRIVIDAGHGGHDTGTIGVDGIREKDVVLDVALRVGKLLHDRLGAQITYTRSDDTFIPLDQRTAIANKAQADLFLSIHANSSPDAAARGVETYYLNFTSDPRALELAARENAVSDQPVHELTDLVKQITLRDKIAESREFAEDVEQSLYGGLQAGNDGLRNRGVKKAPFVVLIGAKMPSVLAEISFVSNAKDAEQMRQPEYLERIAESLYKGVARYEGGLSATRAPVERASAGQ